MIRFSANLGFLWADRPLPAAIHAAKAAGFDGVECHWPYATPCREVSAALHETGLPMLGLNTRRGAAESSDFGLAALPGRETEARDAIGEALEYADAVQATSVHVMAGRASGPEARRTFVRNLSFAAKAAEDREIMILIEPLNQTDVPGYFLTTTGQARDLIAEVGAPNLKLMFDCYHVGRSEGDPIPLLGELLPLIGHIQFASVPDRGPPDRGDVDYRAVFRHLKRLGWTRPLGAEYLPDGDTDASLEWMKMARSPE